MADPLWYHTATTTTSWVTPPVFVTGTTSTANNIISPLSVNQQWYQELYQPSEEEQAWRVEQARQAQERAEREVERRNNSQRRARELLLEHLNARQRREFLAHGHFYVHIETAEGRRRYCVRGLGGVDRVSRGKVESTFCIHPNGYPPADVMLCQKMLLEENEEEFLQIANETRVAAR